MALLKKGLQLGKTIKSVSRLKTIVSVLAKNGFRDLAEKINLGKYLLPGSSNKEIKEKYTTAERLRMSFEELGPSFVKLGQLLSARPDLIPSSFAEEFKKLRDDVKAVPFSEIKNLIEQEYQLKLQDVFMEFEEKPLAAASIAQVHRAKLITGEQVVVKVQRPGIFEIIQQDLIILYSLADLLEQYIEESRVFNPTGIVDEFFKSLELEVNFIIEANNTTKLAKNFQNDPGICFPEIYLDLCTPKILVEKEMQGIPLNNPQAVLQDGIIADEIVERGLRYFLKMVFRDGLFHADLHAGNIFILPENKIGLIDCGVVGHLNHRVRNSVASMFVALATEDYDQLAFDFIDLAPYTDKVQPDVFASELRNLFSPYYGLSFKNLDFGKILLESTGIAAKHGLILPSELLLFFKAVVTVEGMGRSLIKDFDLLKYTNEFSTELLKSQYDSNRLGKNFVHLIKDSNSLLISLPRQIKQALRRLNSPGYAKKIQIQNIESISTEIKFSGKLIFLAIVISSLSICLSAILIAAACNLFQFSSYVFGLPLFAFILVIILAILGLLSSRMFFK